MVMLKHILKYRICTQQIIEIWLSILLSMLHKTVILLSSLYRLIPSHRRYSIHKVALPSRFALFYLSIVMQNRHQQFNLVVGKSSNDIGNLRQINLLFRLSWIKFFFFLLFAHVYNSPATLCSTSKLFWCYRSRCIKIKARTIASFVRYFVS